MIETIILRPYLKIENRQCDVCEIHINKGEFEGVEHQSGHCTFVFENCDFNKVIICNNEEINFEDISINFNYSLIKDIAIATISSENISLSFYNSILSGNINNVKINHIEINNCLTQSLFIQNQQNINLSYTEENIFPVKWKELFDRLGIGSLEEFIQAKQSIFINNSKEINIYGIERGKEKSEGLYRKNYEKVKAFKIGYYLTDEQKALLNLNLSISYSNSINDIKTTIKNINLFSLSLEGNVKGKLSIEQSKINDFYLHNFSTQKETLFFSIAPIVENSKISMHKSNLDNVWFDNVDFSGYTVVSFYRSRFAKSYFASCNFPNDTISFEKFQVLENVHYPENKPDNYYKDQYEIFLQLKEALEKTGNFYEALKLKAISKEALRKIRSTPRSDRFILSINFWSNNHGLSILRPFCGLVILSILFYILYLYSINRIFTTNAFDVTLVGQYFTFLDLTHRKDFLISKNDHNVWSLTIDFINKIVVGFFIYQFIASFRKYGKK